MNRPRYRREAEQRLHSSQFLPAQAYAAELAALLKAGLGLNDALGFCDAQAQELVPALRDRVLRALRAAEFIGSGAAELLETTALEFQRQNQRLQQLELAFEGPRSTARLVALLPLLALGLNLALGLVPIFDITWPIFLSIAAGVGLMSLAWRKCRALLAASEPSMYDPAEFLVMTAACLGAGCQVGEAKRIAGEICLNADVGLIARHEALAARTGIALHGLLRSFAEAVRLRHSHDAHLAIAALPNRMMLPLGLTVLPAFVLIAVIPVVLAQFGSS